jgi:hypothetical protein
MAAKLVAIRLSLDISTSTVVGCLSRATRAVVLPDSTLFGEGVKTRLKEHLMEEAGGCSVSLIRAVKRSRCACLDRQSHYGRRTVSLRYRRFVVFRAVGKLLGGSGGLCRLLSVAPSLA